MDASGAADPSQVAIGAVGLPATEIARLVRSGEVTAVDVVRAHLAHIDAVDARIGAFRVLRRTGLVRPGTGERFRERMVGFFDDVDVLLSPVTTGPPLAARPWHERSFLANITANARWAPWTAAWNLAGLPALVLPAGSRPDGLPVAVQFVGPPGAEARLLWLAGELERLQPWRRYAPVFDPTATSAPAPA